MRCVCVCVCVYVRVRFVLWFLEGFGFCVYERDVCVLVSVSQCRWVSGWFNTFQPVSVM